MDYRGLGRTIWGQAAKVPGAAIDYDYGQGVKNLAGAVWSKPLGRNLMIGAGAYGGTRYIASPIVGSMVNPQWKESVAETGLGNFLTGWDPDSANLQQSILEDQQNEYIERAKKEMAEQRAINEQAYQDRVNFNTNVAYNRAVDLGQLELGLGNVATARNVYADSLSNQVANYLKSMDLANSAVNTILSYRANPI